MKKSLKFQSVVICKINGILQTYKSNEFLIEIIEPEKRKTTIIDAPYIPCKKCEHNICLNQNIYNKFFALLWLLK